MARLKRLLSGMLGNGPRFAASASLADGQPTQAVNITRAKPVNRHHVRSRRTRSLRASSIQSTKLAKPSSGTRVPKGSGTV